MISYKAIQIMTVNATGWQLYHHSFPRCQPDSTSYPGNAKKNPARATTMATAVNLKNFYSQENYLRFLSASPLKINSYQPI